MTEAQIDYAKGIVNELRAQQVRVELEFSNDKLMGQREQEANAVALRIHGKGQQGVKPRAELVTDILTGIRDRRG